MKKCIHRIKLRKLQSLDNGLTRQIDTLSCQKYGHVLCTGTLCPSYVKIDTRGSKTYGIEFYSPNDPFIREEEMKL